MSYCTLTDIKNVIPLSDLIELTDDDDVGAYNLSVINKAISDTDEVIDGYLRGRYSLPLDPVPGMLNALAVEIARYRLYTRRIKLTPPEMIADAYKNAIKLLENVGKGTINIGSAAVTTPSKAKAQFTSSDKVFTRKTLKDY